MKAKLTKILILVLFVLFNIISICMYSYINDKYKNTCVLNHAIDSIKLDMLNDITFDSNHFVKPSKTYKLVSISNSRYDLVEVSHNFDDIVNLINDQNESIKYIDYSQKTKSHTFIDDEVYNYLDVFGFKKAEEVEYVEIYNKEKTFNTDIKLNDFSKIEKCFGKGTLFLSHLKNYDYYIYAYKYHDIYIEFLSFYEDGRNNICLIGKNI